MLVTSLSTLKCSTARPAPFLKWAGGKGQLLETFARFIPRSFNTYFEPFLGGGALFFELMFHGSISEAVISDLNKDLMNCYVVVKDHLEDLVAQLGILQRHSRDKQFFYSSRSRFNEIKLANGLEGNTEKAALLFYLNKTCYNGLYRVNKKGEFNVPWGRYKNPRIFDKTNLGLIHRLLNTARIRILCADYKEATSSAGAGDFIYFDPPYQPVSATATFTAYTSESFGWSDQVRLSEVFRELHSRGCRLMLSNSPSTLALYEPYGFRIERVRANRAISCVGTKRGPVEELVVLNY